ncbi:MAG: PAS domain-containing protein [Planctomycetota bacterium]
MKRPAYPMKIVVASSGTPPKEIVRKLAQAYPQGDVEQATFEESQEIVTSLSEEDRLVIYEDAGSAAATQRVALLRLGRFTVPTVIALAKGGAQVFKNVSLETGLPCIDAGCSAAEIAQTFTQVYEAQEEKPERAKVTQEGVAGSGTPLALGNPLFRIVDSNQAFAGLLQTPRERLLGRPIAAFARVESARRFTRIPLPPRDEEFATEATDGEGGKKRVVVRRRALFAGSVLLGCVYAFIEGKEFKELMGDLAADSERIAAAKKDLESALDAIRDPVIITDNASKIGRANRALAQRLGRTWRGIIGEPGRPLLGGIGGQAIPLGPPPDLEGGPVKASSVPVAALQGIFDIDSFPRYEQDGRPDGWVHLMREVGGGEGRMVRRAPTEALHQMTNCITSILGLSDLAAGCADTPEAAQEDLRKIADQAKRLADLIRRLRGSSSDAGAR